MLDEHSPLPHPLQRLDPSIISRLQRWLYPNQHTRLDPPLQHQLLKHRRCV
ncbi:hypothetical protein FOXYSP1_19953 [Fusarium oxysporum f. sp. phaseoli]